MHRNWKATNLRDASLTASLSWKIFNACEFSSMRTRSMYSLLHSSRLLNNHQLTGPIPEALRLPNLETLQVVRGLFPRWSQYHSNSTSFPRWLRDNEFTGHIPPRVLSLRWYVRRFPHFYFVLRRLTTSSMMTARLISATIVWFHERSRLGDGVNLYAMGIPIETASHAKYSRINTLDESYSIWRRWKRHGRWALWYTPAFHDLADQTISVLSDRGQRCCTKQLMTLCVPSNSETCSIQTFISGNHIMYSSWGWKYFRIYPFLRWTMRKRFVVITSSFILLLGYATFILGGTPLLHWAFAQETPTSMISGIFWLHLRRIIGLRVHFLRLIV